MTGKYVLSGVLSAFSVFGSLIILCSSLTNINLRQHPTSLVLYLAASDFFFALKYLVTSSVSNSTAFTTDYDTCDLQAIWGQFWGIASTSWNAIICLNLFVNMAFPFKNTSKWSPFYHLYVWGLAFVTTILVATIKPEKYIYVTTDLTCWEVDEWLELTFFGPLLVYMIFSLGVTCFGLYALTSLRKRSLPDRVGMIIRMILYTFIFILCWSGQLTASIYQHYNQTPDEFIQYWAIVGLSIQGFLNSMVWITNPSFFESINRKYTYFVSRVSMRRIEDPLFPKSVNDLIIQQHDIQRLDILMRRCAIDDLLRGIQHSTQKRIDTFDQDLNEKTFFVKHTSKLWSEESKLQIIPHMYRFKDYAPVIFNRIRLQNNVSTQHYLTTLFPEKFYNSQFLEKFSDGRSGSFFFFSPDKQFLIKTLPKNEAHQLFSLLIYYYDHISQNPDNLLPRFYGLYSVKINYDNIYFVVMGNSLWTSLTLHYRFDLKGSWINRKALRTEEDNLASVVGMDTDLDNKNIALRLSQIDRDHLIRLLSKDAKFLMNHNIMDYSILLGIHLVERSDVSSDSFRTVSAEQDIPMENLAADVTMDIKPWFSEDGSEMYFISIIDCLQAYNFSKKFERFWKVTILRKDSEGISVQPPYQYYNRFMKFARQKLILSDGALDPTIN